MHPHTTLPAGRIFRSGRPARLIPPIFHSTSFGMRNDQPDQRLWRWSLLASLFLNLLVAALILPRSLVSPLKEEQAITVDLVQSIEPPPKPKAEAPPPAKPAPPPADGAAKPLSPKAADERQATQPIIKPVFLFGDKDRGPRKAWDGNSSETGSARPPARPDPAQATVPTTPPVTTAATEQGPPDASTKTAAAPAQTQAQVRIQVQPGSKLHEAKTLFSQETSNDINAMIAMGNMSRGERAGQLCITELHEQLLHASPPYIPDMLPRERLEQGSVLEDAKAAFSSNSQWYDLSYRCEVDAQATKVTAFAFQVGSPVPRSDWKSRGLPSP
ncbi:DUF930 domain-containing protein [Labrys sp. LIt4]|uniref:DUF930 domain-containing protein n=1 Tax=Labrys sp. LIt4 TaxID=2821355 RepID=UPI001ADEE347|nr:DUF930 domain-containing protein [Labrys sp. LIt4]MBP0581346.1 DUF930 domain-containing protein [Labrys sp. LIt4]